MLGEEEEEVCDRDGDDGCGCCGCGSAVTALIVVLVGWVLVFGVEVGGRHYRVTGCGTGGVEVSP